MYSPLPPALVAYFHSQEWYGKVAAFTHKHCAPYAGANAPRFLHCRRCGKTDETVYPTLKVRSMGCWRSATTHDMVPLCHECASNSPYLLYHLAMASRPRLTEPLAKSGG